MFPLFKETTPLGGGVTVCMSQGSANLIHEEGYDMIQTDYPIGCTDVNNPTDEIHQSMQELKIDFHDTCELVEGDMDLVKTFSDDLKQCQHKILTMLSAKALELSHTSSGEWFLPIWLLRSCRFAKGRKVSVVNFKVIVN